MARACFLLAIALSALALGAVETQATDIANTDSNPGLHCSPTRWYNVLFFFVTNYVIHVATVISLPGESGFTSAAYKACCLLIPFAGIRRGLNIFLRGSALPKSSLHGAARANALCMIVRSNTWRPRIGDVIEGCKFEVKEPPVDGATSTRKRFWKKSNAKSKKAWTKAEERPRTDALCGLQKEVGGSITESVDPKSLDVIWRVKAPYEHRAPTSYLGKLGDFMLHSYRFRAMSLERQVVERKDIEVHGVCELPQGYALCFVPPHMDVRPRGASSHKVKLSSQFNALQVMWSLAQTLIGSRTLWQSRGSQLNRYGYAAFGLTVIPYVIASLINLLGSLVSRQYNDVYLIHSEIMDEAIERGAVVDGVVGTISPLDEIEQDKVLGEDEHGRLGDATFTFGGDADGDGSQRCFRLDSTTVGSKECPVLLNLPPPKKPKTPSELGHGRFRSCWVNFWNLVRELTPWYKYDYHHHPKPTKRKPLTSTQYTISVPNNGRFRRLPPTGFELPFKIIASLLLIICVTAPYLIIYLLTGYKPQQATSTQTNMTTHWLCLGQMYGLIVTEFERNTGKHAWGVIFLMVLAFYGWAAVGGTVIVVEEMFEFGTCSTW